MGQMYQEGLGCVGVLRRYAREELPQLASNGWRLPTRDELLTLIDNQRKEHGTDPYINVVVFPDIPRDGESYWTSTPFDRNQLWCIDFGTGVGDNCGPYPESVRLLRDHH